QSKLDQAGWPDGLIDRVLALRRDRGELEAWLDMGFPTPEMLGDWVPLQETLLGSTLTTRQATWEDHQMLADLCADAPERVGDWSVTVDRGPNPYAQYRLQEHPSVIVLEDQRIGLGMAASSVRNTFIDGEPTSVHMMSGWRIRDGFRGLGLSRMLQNAAGPGVGWFGLVSYWFVRSGNASSTWIDKVVADIEDRGAGFGAATDALTASVTHFGRTELGERSPRVRPATSSDAPACIDLINSTHNGLDLFRPYTESYLDERMQDPNWGPKPSFYHEVYGLDDHRVLEVDGRIVACAGLWDRGRDVREVWQKDDERFVVDPAAMLDFGYAEGQEAAMVELIVHLMAETDDLGRSGLLAPLEYVPAVAELTSDLHPTVETRQLHVLPFSSPDLTIELTISRPYIDLAYW
ncbi:MAG: hypothetical protein ACR2QK_01065, partial [Acidimicrobiales bacterium]